jgi:hypothetical protein
MGRVKIAEQTVSYQGEMNAAEFILRLREVYWRNFGGNEGDGMPLSNCDKRIALGC